MLNFAQIPILNRVVYFDPDYQAWLDRGVTLGYTTPSYKQQIAMNEWVIRLKEDGLWTKFDILYWFAIDGNNNMATINFKDPNSFQCSQVTSPTFTTNQGFTGTNNGYLSTNFNPSTNGVQYTLNDANRCAYVFNTGSTNQIDGVAAPAANRMLVQSSTNHRINQGTTALNSAADLSGTGYKAITRTSSTNVILYNGTTQISRTATSSAVISAAQLILRSDGISGVGLTVSFYGLGASLTQTEHGLLRTHILNLLAAL